MDDTVALIVVIGLASYRATRLLTRDTITDPVRTLLARWAYDESRDKWRSTRRRAVVNFSTCPWCVGVWVSGGLYAVWDHVRDLRFLVVVLAVAGVQGFVSSRPGA